VPLLREILSRTRQFAAGALTAMEIARMPSSPLPASRMQSLSRGSEHARREGEEPTGRRLFFNNEEAARFLNLSPRTLEKQRVIGDGPRFRKFGRRVVYALTDLQAWADARAYESTSDPQYPASR